MHPFGNSSVTGDLHSIGSKHCTTCQCGDNHNMFQFSGRKSTLMTALTQPPQNMVQSRVIPQYDPSASQVGNDVIPNRTVWFRSVSPRPSKITIRVSSPDRPSLRPSEYSSSLHKRTVSSHETETNNGVQFSRIIDPEATVTTPMKKLVSLSTLDSTMYSPDLTERRTAAITSMSQL